MDEGRHHKIRTPVKEAEATTGTCSRCGRENQELGNGLCQQCYDGKSRRRKEAERDSN